MCFQNSCWLNLEFTHHDIGGNYSQLLSFAAQILSVSLCAASASTKTSEGEMLPGVRFAAGDCVGCAVSVPLNLAFLLALRMSVLVSPDLWRAAAFCFLSSAAPIHWPAAQGKEEECAGLRSVQVLFSGTVDSAPHPSLDSQR